MDEEVVLLEEQLAAANADVERLQGRLGELESALAGWDAEAATLRTQLASAQDEASQAHAVLTQRDADLETLRQALDATAAEGRNAASRYRELLMASEPSLPADLVFGDSVSEIDDAAARARQTVAQVRQHLETRAQALRVPAGAPARGVPDTSAMTPAEKIRSGLRGT
jgi:cell division septum initiation protein DivIVA